MSVCEGEWMKGSFPQLKDVVGTNFCDIGVMSDWRNIIVISSIDNLVKGASGQAVQNMNIKWLLAYLDRGGRTIC